MESPFDLAKSLFEISARVEQHFPEKVRVRILEAAITALQLHVDRNRNDTPLEFPASTEL